MLTTFPPSETFSAKVIQDSISGDGIRLVTVLKTGPKFILAEENTHRTISKSTSSARAIPTASFLAKVKADPFTIVHWGKAQKGMGAQEEVPVEVAVAARELWLEAACSAVSYAEKLSQLGLAKQVVNRLVEPFSFCTSVWTATSWENMYNLRDHADAQPEFQHLISLVKQAFNSSTPVAREFGDWHLPFVTDEERNSFPVPFLLKYSAARCSRTSYLNHDKAVDRQKDCDSHDKLLVAGHMSPLEHQATPVSGDIRAGNFQGWLQYRKTLSKEAVWMPR